MPLVESFRDYKVYDYLSIAVELLKKKSAYFLQTYRSIAKFREFRHIFPHCTKTNLSVILVIVYISDLHTSHAPISYHYPSFCQTNDI